MFVFVIPAYILKIVSRRCMVTLATSSSMFIQVDDGTYNVSSFHNVNVIGYRRGERRRNGTLTWFQQYLISKQYTVKA